LLAARFSVDLLFEAAHSPLDPTPQTQTFRLIPDDADVRADQHFAQAQQELRAANLPAAQVEMERALALAEVWLTENAGSDNVASQAAWLRHTYQIYLELLLRRQQQDPHGEFAALAWQANDHLHWLLANLSKKDELAAQAQLRVLTVSDVQRRLLDEQHVLLEYALGAERSYVWLIGKTSFYCAELPAKDVIEAKALRLHALLSTQPETVINDPAEGFDRTAQELSAMLLSPVAPLLKGQRLLIVADGVLKQVPFSVLPTPDGGANSVKWSSTARPLAREPLLAQYEIVTLPSAATGLWLRWQHPGQPVQFTQDARSVAVIADPVFGKYDERVVARSEQPVETASTGNPLSEMLTQLRNLDLPTAFGLAPANQPLLGTRLFAARQEAEAITRIVPHSTQLLDFAANRTMAMSGVLAHYPILHFATHGFSHPQNPALSGLLLSQVNERGEAVNGLLLNQEIRQMHLPAELVVLSACETDLVERPDNESYASVAHSFLEAGAHRVIASLWKVNDSATAELMQRFYQQLFEHTVKSPSEALRQAQLEMWRAGKWKQPFYWAAFVLQGED
jgi:CHAT domain-containing protein